MGQLILYIASSLDGYVARSSGAVDWLFTDQDYGYEDFYATCDRLIMGRNTYEQIQSWGEYPYPDKQGFVFDVGDIIFISILSDVNVSKFIVKWILLHISCTDCEYDIMRDDGDATVLVLVGKTEHLA